MPEKKKPNFDLKNNPRNPKSKLFQKLTTLMSGPLVLYRTQTERRLVKRQLDKYHKKIKGAAAGQSFKKSEFQPFQHFEAHYLSQQRRLERYLDFDQMEFEPIIGSALDIYADEMTTSSDVKKILNIKCQNEEIRTILHSLYYNIINIEHNAFGLCRSMCKYGDHFMYLDIDEVNGVQRVISIPTQEVERLEGEDEDNPNYIRFLWTTANLTFENWQIAHFRVLGNDKFAPYGSSVLEAARRVFRQLILLEDAMMAYRVVRAPERRAFYIDVGNTPPEDIETVMEKAVTSMKRNTVVDAGSGQANLRYNPFSVEEDFFVPVRGAASGNRIESLPGGDYVGVIDDVKYIKDKLFAAIKIPQSYLFRGEDAGEDNASLSMKDIRFARTIQRLQRAAISELEKIGIVHLYILGYRDDDLVSFELSFNNPSKISELQELEHWKTKFDVANAAVDGFFSKRWIAENIFNLTEEEVIRNQREMFHDQRFQTLLDSLMDESEEGSNSARGGLSDIGGGEPLLASPDTDGGAAMEEPGMGGGEEGMMPPSEESQGEEMAADNKTLLTAPAKRDSKNASPKLRGDGKANFITTTAASKGKWHRPKDVGRDGRVNSSGRRRSWQALSQQPKSDLFAGLKHFGQIRKGILQEANDEQPIYDEEKDK